MEPPSLGCLSIGNIRAITTVFCLAIARARFRKPFTSGNAVTRVPTSTSGQTNSLIRTVDNISKATATEKRDARRAADATKKKATTDEKAARRAANAA